MAPLYTMDQANQLSAETWCDKRFDQLSLLQVPLCGVHISSLYANKD